MTRLDRLAKPRVRRLVAATDASRSSGCDTAARSAGIDISPLPAHGVEDRAARDVPSRCLGAGRTDRLGHASAATATRPSTISASATAYCSPRRNPLVPSIGSSVQNRSLYWLPPPWSIQRQTCSASITTSGSPSASDRTARTWPSTCSRMARVLRPSQLGRVFLGDHGVVRKRLGQRPADQRLAAEVGHGDRALVLLGQDLRRDLAGHRPAKPRRFAHGLDRHGLLTFVKSAHGWHPRNFSLIQLTKRNHSHSGETNSTQGLSTRPGSIFPSLSGPTPVRLA